MEDSQTPLIKKSERKDTLEQTSFFNSFVLGQAVKKTGAKTRVKVELTPEQLDLNRLMGEAKSYILKNSENTVATPFSITCMDASSDSGAIVFGSSNGNISRYDLKESKIIDDIPLNVGKINSIKLDEQNERAILVGETPIVRIYKLPRFEIELELAGHTMGINKCAIKEDANIIYTISDDSTVKMWNINEKSSKDLMKHNGMGKCLALSGCGKYLFTGGEDCLIRVYDMLFDEEVLNLKSHSGCVWSLTLNSDSTLLASGGADNLVIVWNILDFTPMHVFEEHLGIITTLKFAYNNNFLVSGSEDNSMRVLDLEKDRRELSLNSHTGPIRELLITSDNEYIISCSDDKSIKIWSFPEFMEESNFKVLGNDFNSVIDFNDEIISCGSDRNIRRWNRETDEASIIGNTKGIGLKCSKSIEEILLAVGDDYGYLYVFDKTNNLIKEFQAHKGPIRDMCFLHNGNLVTGGGDSKVTIWDINTWIGIQLRGHQQSIWCLGYCASNQNIQILASGSSDKTVRLWNLETKEEISVFQLKEQATALSITNDGRYMITGGILGTLTIWSISEKAEESVFRLQADMITGIQVTKDCEYFISVSKDCSIHFLSLLYRVPISFITRKQPILCLAISCDNLKMITGEYQMIYLQDNPIVSLSTRILGPENDVLKFLTYMKGLINDEPILPDTTMDKFIILPYFFNTLHFYSDMGLRQHLAASLAESPCIIPSQFGYHPLQIALIKGFKDIRDIIVDALITLGSDNPFIFQILENVIVNMNNKAFPKLGALYDAIYQPTSRKTLPKFCLTDIELPIYNVSEYPRVDINDYFEPTDIATHGQGIIFKESYVKLNYSMGSSESLKFLDSLSSCNNLDVLRSPLIMSMIQYKWKQAKYPIMIQGLCFYAYLIILSFYTAFCFGGDPTRTFNTIIEAVLFITNTLLLVYELFQMTVSGAFYFSYVWNYIDWCRGISLYFFIISDWIEIGGGFSNSVFSLVVFFSFIRGFSYFRLFDNTRYLVNLLFQVAADIRGFLVLLSYSTLAFCFLFIVLGSNSEEAGDAEGNPITFSSYLMVSYNLVLGSFETKEYNIVEYFCLTVALLINPIIMLNLLISIIGDTYDRVQSDNLSANMKELLDMILEVENMLFVRRNQNKKMFFQECSEYEKEDEEGGWEGKLRAIEKSIEVIESKNSENYDSIVKKMKTQDKFIEVQTEKIDMIMKKMFQREKEEAKKRKGK